MAGTLDDRVEQWLNEPHRPEREVLIAIVDHCTQKEQAGWTCVSTDFLREVITTSLGSAASQTSSSSAPRATDRLPASSGASTTTPCTTSPGSTGRAR